MQEYVICNTHVCVYIYINIYRDYHRVIGDKILSIMGLVSGQLLKAYLEKAPRNVSEMF